MKLNVKAPGLAVVFVFFAEKRSLRGQWMQLSLKLVLPSLKLSSILAPEIEIVKCIVAIEDGQGVTTSQTEAYRVSGAGDSL